MNKIKRKLTDISFEHEGAHVSLVSKTLQGGPANQRTTLVVKSLSEDQINVDMNKAAFYSQMRTQLQAAVKEKYGDDKEWLYVEDFNDSVVIFCNEKGLYSVGHSLVNGEVVLDDLANPVTGMLSYVPTTGNMLLSEDAEDKLEEGIYSLVTKALESESTKEHLVEMFKSKQKEVEILEQEIRKAVEAAEAVLKAKLEEQTSELQKALAKVEEFEKAQKEVVEKSRKESLAKVVAEDEVEAVYKSLEALSQEAFDVVVKSFEKKAKVEQESELFKEKGVSGEGEPVKQEEAGLKLVGDIINKSKKQKQ